VRLLLRYYACQQSFQAFFLRRRGWQKPVQDISSDSKYGAKVPPLEEIGLNIRRRVVR
jgi:hypothetical protein